MKLRTNRAITSITMIVCFVVPLGLMIFTDLPYAGALFLIGLICAYQVWRGRRMLEEIDDFDQAGERQRRAAERQNRGTTIYVPLLDDAGAPLDPAAAERLLARARMMAGPRETVVGVERTPADARKL